MVPQNDERDTACESVITTVDSNITELRLGTPKLVNDSQLPVKMGVPNIFGDYASLPSSAGLETNRLTNYYRDQFSYERNRDQFSHERHFSHERSPFSKSISESPPATEPPPRTDLSKFWGSMKLLCSPVNSQIEVSDKGFCCFHSQRLNLTENMYWFDCITGLPFVWSIRKPNDSPEEQLGGAMETLNKLLGDEKPDKPVAKSRKIVKCDRKTSSRNTSVFSIDIKTEGTKVEGKTILPELIDPYPTDYLNPGCAILIEILPTLILVNLCNCQIRVKLNEHNGTTAILKRLSMCPLTLPPVELVSSCRLVPCPPKKYHPLPREWTLSVSISPKPGTPLIPEMWTTYSVGISIDTLLSGAVQKIPYHSLCGEIVAAIQIRAIITRDTGQILIVSEDCTHSDVMIVNDLSGSDIYLKAWSQNDFPVSEISKIRAKSYGAIIGLKKVTDSLHIINTEFWFREIHHNRQSDASISDLWASSSHHQYKCQIQWSPVTNHSSRIHAFVPVSASRRLIIGMTNVIRKQIS